MNNLNRWITDLKRRGCTITTHQSMVRVEGPATPHDRQHAARWRHALTVAANGTHHEWWNHIVGRPTRPLHLDDIPVAKDDPDAFACACCGQPADHLADDLTAWCHACRTAHKTAA